jgi:hypothetical protein
MIGAQGGPIKQARPLGARPDLEPLPRVGGRQRHQAFGASLGQTHPDALGGGHGQHVGLLPRFQKEAQLMVGAVDRVGHDPGRTRPGHQGTLE